MFAIPRLLGNNGNNESTDSSGISDSAEEESGIYSDFDEEQISAAIEEAEALAENEDYEGTLTKIKAALATYPESELYRQRKKNMRMHLQHR